ncbi:MAG TPA: FAD-binding protein, partial [Methylotenera sp.]|nr:FAD-binding protein [Methylotenera sp.]
QFWNAPIDVLIAGHEVQAVAEQTALIAGIHQVIHADAAQLKHQLAEHVAKLVASIGHEYAVILAAHSSFSRNILPRVAALLDVAMVSDVLEIQADNTYVRATYAGNVLTTLQSKDPIQVLTVHSSNFAAVEKSSTPTGIVSIQAPNAEYSTRWISEDRAQSERPALSTAKIVISGGRSLGSAETFEQLLSPLATKLGAALGATRAAVDAGYAPNDIQVGQTGVSVAPDLYIAVGVSGAVQHTYGMKDSKIVVAINQDLDAPIFQVADYGLVADLFEAIPELTAAI